MRFINTGMTNTYCRIRLTIRNFVRTPIEIVLRKFALFPTFSMTFWSMNAHILCAFSGIPIDMGTFDWNRVEIAPRSLRKSKSRIGRWGNGRRGGRSSGSSRGPGEWSEEGANGGPRKRSQGRRHHQAQEPPAIPLHAPPPTWSKIERKTTVIYDDNVTVHYMKKYSDIVCFDVYMM
ncbi:hypothetical protein CEXT_640271 [Caerostris extrusa]|uniref:Uncharacterized protein n=1 Tax=Caerostris extrusa TaxID=172846 RepID=A0AAV4QNF8_CAEEX|nr:hypothetical protein CEXT_640271 [Caerostris extrusa]